MSWLLCGGLAGRLDGIAGDGTFSRWRCCEGEERCREEKHSLRRQSLRLMGKATTPFDGTCEEL